MFTTPLTPFSGISLIVHLAIIGTAKIFGLFGKKNYKFGGKGGEHVGGLARVMNVLISFLIFFAVSGIMLASTVFAVNASVREGANEWQVKYVEQQFEYIRENPPKFIYRAMTIGYGEDVVQEARASENY